jgi:hypothetical protein
MTEYNFTIKLHPWADVPNSGIVEIDPVALYGYFERKDGSEGGGLWFDRHWKTNHLNLVDFDGMYVLPMKVITALRAAGVIVDVDFE